MFLAFWEAKGEPIWVILGSGLGQFGSRLPNSVELELSTIEKGVSCEINFPLYLKCKLFPTRDLTPTETNAPFCHSMDISKAPLPLMPEILPLESADGSAGRIS